ncbi:MAG: AAA family ATPase [Methanomicrobiales archaeon]|nr:AAA family ATPase [Methanomicrobiales archaeon]
MKILKLKFSNLNSLAGTWIIDFTDPVFTSSGFFVITGPTGSGKTTVLDAICLALYGRTPRLGKVTKTSNHIMSRHTGDCSAEVVFESQKGRFICNWNQRRARNKPEGELQSPQHEISRADSGEILGTKMNQVQEIVEEVTGMDYYQFTRSILLAQGGFAAFLQAGADERAPILEQITGTAIYSELSKNTHERYTKEREKLEQLNQELDSISVLSPEEKENIKQQIENLQKTAVETDGEITQITDAIRWIEAVEKLRCEIRDLETDKAHLVEKQGAFEPSRIALLAAKKAALFQGLYASLELKRDTLEKDTERQVETVRIRDILQSSLPDLENAVSSAQTGMKQAEREREEGIRLIQIIRALDKEIGDKEAGIKRDNKELEGLQNLLTDYNNNLKQAERRKQEILDIKNTANHYINQHASDATIRDQYSGFEEKTSKIREHLDTIEKEKTDCTEQEIQILKAKKELTELQKKKEQQQRLLKEREEEQKDLEKNLEKLLLEYSLSDLRKSHDETKIQVERLNRLKEVQVAIKEISSRWEALEKKRDDLIHYLQVSGYEKDRIESDLTHCEEHLEISRKAAFLAAKVRDLTIERNQLIDGKPCPLCGSLHHPFVTGQEFEPEEVIREFIEEENRIKNLSRQLTTLTTKIAEKEGELNRCLEDIIECETTRNEQHKRWKEGTDALGMNSETDCASLTSCIEVTSSKLRNLDTTLHNAEQCEEKIRKSAPLLIKCREQLNSQEKECREKEFEIESRKNRIDQHQNGIVTGEKKVTTYFDELVPILAGLGCTISRETNITALLLTLRNRQKKYQEEEDKIRTCEEQLRKIEAEISGLSAKISEKTDEITRKTGHLRVEEEKFLTLKDERKHKFGEKDTDSEEKRLTEAVSKAREILEARQKEKTDLSNRLQSSKDLISDLEKRINTTNNDIHKSLEIFLSQIHSAGFADEEEYKASFMKPEEISRLEKAWEDIRTEQTRIHERQSLAITRYEDEKKKNLTSKPISELQAELISFQEQKTQYITDIGKNQEKLSQHEEMIRQLGEKIAGRDKQQHEVDKWSRLHELIGSADGKKFRVFAQGLTFSILLAHANQHLQQMTDRYILIQDKSIPLDMQVIDNWQGGVTRSVKNLSGGEVFIVSLALALGLSGMASKNVRVDSLFLDEGFGTLDDEALETALTTLAGLKHEGKLIGVISHVNALKERIPTRIIIEKGNNGHSRIIIPE